MVKEVIGKAQYDAVFANGMTINAVTTEAEFPNIASKNDAMWLILGSVVYDRSVNSGLTINNKKRFAISGKPAPKTPMMLSRTFSITGGSSDGIISNIGVMPHTHDGVNQYHLNPLNNDAWSILGSAASFPNERPRDPLLDPGNITITECFGLGGQDECLQALRNLKDITLYKNFFGAPVYDPASVHDYGVVIRGCDNALVKENLMAGFVMRMVLAGSDQTSEDPYLGPTIVRQFGNLMVGTGRIAGSQTFMGLNCMDRNRANPYFIWNNSTSYPAGRWFYAPAMGRFVSTKTAIVTPASGTIENHITASPSSYVIQGRGGPSPMRFTAAGNTACTFSVPGPILEWFAVAPGQTDLGFERGTDLQAWTAFNRLRKADGTWVESGLDHTTPTFDGRLAETPSLVKPGDLGIAANAQEHIDALRDKCGPAKMPQWAIDLRAMYLNGFTGVTPRTFEAMDPLFDKRTIMQPVTYYGGAADPIAAKAAFKTRYLVPRGLDWGVKANPDVAASLWEEVNATT